MMLVRIGNKKLADAPVPDDDISYLLSSLGLSYQQSLQEEIHGRAQVKGAYRGKYCDHQQKSRGLDMIRAAKKKQVINSLTIYH